MNLLERSLLLFPDVHTPVPITIAPSDAYLMEPIKSPTHMFLKHLRPQHLALNLQRPPSQIPTFTSHSHPVSGSKISPFPRVFSLLSSVLHSFIGLGSWLAIQERGRRSHHSKQASILLQVPKEAMA